LKSSLRAILILLSANWRQARGHLARRFLKLLNKRTAILYWLQTEKIFFSY